MDIGSLWFTQHCLKRSWNIKSLMRLITEGDSFSTPISLQECEDGEVEIVNGHHRIAALWLLGKTKLDRWDYALTYVLDGKLRRFWQVSDLREKTNLLELEDAPYPC
jgi:hypothetical protein